MKFSEAMLKGFEKVGGKQCRGQMWVISGGRPVAYCAIGAASAGGMTTKEMARARHKMYSAWGVYLLHLNDEEGLPWEHIYGMAVAAGL